MIYVLIILIAIIAGNCVKYSVDTKYWKKHLNKNFPFKWKGRHFWYSRSVAVTCFVIAKEKYGVDCVLVNKRGKGTPDFQGCWNIPCGYLDFDETGEQAAKRELFEETGININPSKLKLYKVNTSPSSNRQNVTLTYGIRLDTSVEENLNFSTEHSEKNEVESIKWIPISDIDGYKWAFNHQNLISEIYKKMS